MTSSKSSDSPLKKTSHYYKKKLSTPQQDPLKYQPRYNSTKLIEKKPKQPKLRAKQARQRKKFYIEKLQDKISMLEKQLKTYKEKSSAIQSSNSAFINITRPDKPTQISLDVKSILKKAQTAEYTEQVIKLAGIQNAFRRLYGAVQLKNQEEAQKSIQVLRKRFGVSGQQRVKWFQQLLLKIVSIMMPMHCRLLLENCQNRQEFYKLIGCDESMKEERKLYFDKDTVSTLCESRPAMVEIKQHYKRIILNIAEISQKMVKEASELQQEIDKIQNSMNPLFVGKILVDLDVQRKKTEDMNDIFPVNFYKEQVIKKRERKELQQEIKQQQQEILQRSIDDDLIGVDRMEGFSDEELYLLSMLSD